ncbi:Na(+) H(+) antiporter subunit F [Caenispirillum salinarum AK4]|uniref:Na(+) H(+) antiporter subunit F n=1 Tax=Caenispirillum salinarum AK4 TaxID=1238182 RepID=K9HHH7_9PROT|nr:monovalent cation/H+ antiporter complex subunit F [Caenispirillum salinarum]EKV28071.1 Na(+) H(+) antiporter subunit F [Caenispirillum salinarum AK4]
MMMMEDVTAFAEARPIIAVAAVVASVLLAAAFALAAWRVARGPTLPDRVVGLDTVALLALCVTGLLALTAGAPAMLDAALALALVAFLGTLAFARFAETRPEASIGIPGGPDLEEPEDDDDTPKEHRP